MTGALANRGDSASRLEEEAAAWAARIDAAPDVHHPGLEPWLKEDPAHAGALLRAQATLVMLGGAVPEVASAAPEPSPESRRRVPRRWLAAAGAGVLAASLAGVVWTMPGGERIHTGIGEVRSVALHDGSALAVDSRTSLIADVGTTRRVVTLKDGKALFRVRHDAGAPFRVRVGDVTITDIGTVFQVTADRDAGTVEVLVAEGRVAVQSGAGTVQLAAGQRARFALAEGDAALRTPPVRVDAAAIDRALGWTSGRLELDGETLGAAVTELNRHNRLQIRLGDPALAGEKLYGAFRMDDPAGFAQAAALGIGARARIGDEAIAIDRPEKKLPRP